MLLSIGHILKGPKVQWYPYNQNVMGIIDRGRPKPFEEFMGRVMNTFFTLPFVTVNRLIDSIPKRMYRNSPCYNVCPRTVYMCKVRCLGSKHQMHHTHWQVLCHLQFHWSMAMWHFISYGKSSGKSRIKCVGNTHLLLFQFY